MQDITHIQEDGESKNFASLLCIHPSHLAAHLAFPDCKQRSLKHLPYVWGEGVLTSKYVFDYFAMSNCALLAPPLLRLN